MTELTKWELFLDGFRNMLYALDCYETVEHFPDDFWESLSWGYMQMEIFPYDDWYNPEISKQRKMLYGIRE